MKREVLKYMRNASLTSFPFSSIIVDDIVVCRVAAEKVCWQDER